MVSFLDETIDSILGKHAHFSELTIVLPSKRAGAFFKHILRKKIRKTTFLPKIISIEEFVESIADLRIIDYSQVILKSYDVYLQTDSIKEKEKFDTYVGWIQTLLNDFNELDRYLVDTKSFFDYLNSIKALEKWKVDEQQSDLITNYLSFWKSLPEFYEKLQQSLLSEGIGYQGMVYRKATEELEHYLASHGHQTHIFIGFNALNTAEETIIKEILETGNSEIYFDAEKYFFETSQHSAAAFMVDYFKNWKFFRTNKPQLGTNFENPKTIQLVECQKNIAQVKYVGEILSRFSEEQLNNTAVVLADETLLIPLLYSLPANVDSVNVTMGVPLKNLPATNFIATLLRIHTKRPSGFYYKDVFTLLNNPTAATLLGNTKGVVQKISSENRTYISKEDLKNLFNDDKTGIVDLIFGDWADNAETAIQNCLSILVLAKDRLNHNPVEKVLIFELHKILLSLEKQRTTYPHISALKTLYSLFLEAIGSASMDLKGDAYNGLQVMGVLETRVLDFENVIITSVNEGVLPAGKSQASFITYDLKTQYGLPSYSDKDAIYTYHFYHLLHRSSKVWLLYNNHSEGLNAGEKSRFVLQLQLEGHPKHKVETSVLTPKTGIDTSAKRTIEKTTDVLDRIKEIGLKGFSPSALTTYIRNPIDFYLQRILGVLENDQLEETVAYNTLGTIVHNALQNFYEPLEGLFLELQQLEGMKKNIHEEVTRQFHEIFKKGTFSTGKNLLIFEVAKRYLENLVALDETCIRNGNQIKILGIEKKFHVQIEMDELETGVFLRGTVDRIDEFNGTLRVIDYKTGNVQQGDVELISWDELTSDYKFSKAFQVLAYAYMISKGRPVNSMEAGIISFRNMGGGFLKFGTKPSSHSRVKQQQLSSDTLNDFERELRKLISELFNPVIPFTEKEV